MGDPRADARAKLLDLDDPEVTIIEDPDEAETAPPPGPASAYDPLLIAAQATFRERAATLPDPEAVEQARIASVLLDSSPPARPSSARERMSPLERVPVLTKKLTELGAVLEDPKTAFVLGFVDGLLPLEAIVDVAALPEEETLLILERVMQEGLLRFR